MSTLFWYITDMWEEFYAIPVNVKHTEASGRIVVVWDLGQGITQEYKIYSLSQLYNTKAEAENEATHRNALAINGRNDYA